MERQEVVGIFHAKRVILRSSVYSLAIAQEKAVIGMPSPKMKRKFIYVVNYKFLGKCWYGRHPWIRLAMDCERMVEKGINFILCLRTAYDVSSMESIGNSRSFSLTEKYASQNILLLLLPS